MSAAPVFDSWKGQLVDGKFPLLERIAGSESSDVFLTELPPPAAQKAAIKLIPASARNADIAIARWRAAAQLSHPHLMRIFHAGRCKVNSAPVLYVVTEYAEEDLAQILPSRPLTAAETGEMLRAVVDALAFIHGRGLVHGRIKPSNVMAVNDQLKLSSDSLQPAGEHGGLLAGAGLYDAPEIATEAISPAADMWSLGMTVTAALTQHPAIWDESRKTGPLVPDSVPEPFHEIVRECLRLDPGQRCTLEQIKARLQPLTVSDGTSRSRRGALIAAQVVLIALLAGLWVVTHRSPTKAPAKAVPQQEAAPAPAQQPAPPAVTENTPGAVAQRVVPDVPRSARNTIQGKIKVSVRAAVDAAGNVSAARLERAGPSKYFAGLALASARRWRFQPPQIAGKAVPSQWTLHFQFTRANTEVVPVETAP
jgi:TonB family protein